MSDLGGVWVLFAGGAAQNDAIGGWGLLAVGLFAILGTLFDVRAGRVWGSYRTTWGLTQTLDVEREFAPIQFWVRVLLQLLVGLALVFFGVRLLLLS
jgi:hypothetical protein